MRHPNQSHYANLAPIRKRKPAFPIREEASLRIICKAPLFTPPSFPCSTAPCQLDRAVVLKPQLTSGAHTPWIPVCLGRCAFSESRCPKGKAITLERDNNAAIPGGCRDQYYCDRTKRRPRNLPRNSRLIVPRAHALDRRQSSSQYRSRDPGQDPRNEQLHQTKGQSPRHPQIPGECCGSISIFPSPALVTRHAGMENPPIRPSLWAVPTSVTRCRQ